MKRVLQISNYLYPHIGGIEQVARDIANALSKDESIEQKIICFNETAEDGDIVCKRNETVHDVVDGVEVIRCGCITKKASQSISLSFDSELKRTINEFKPEIVIFHYPNPFQAACLKKHLNQGVRFIVYWHLDITKQKTLRKLFHRQTLNLLERADKVIATSPVYIDGSPYLSHYKKKCIVIPNCIDTERLKVTDKISNRAQQIREENRGKIICFGVGRHIPYKGFTYLVKASKLLDDRFKIFIGGKGPLTNDLKAEAKDDQKIVFLGRISDEDLIAYYLAMDIFCFPSITKNEAFGIALAEGMYFGKPAVTFTIRGSGVNYVNQKDVTGLEVPNGDFEKYAEAIECLGNNVSLREEMGQAAEKRVKEFFLKDRFIMSIQALLRDYNN